MPVDVFYLTLFHFLRLQKEKWMNVRVGDIIKLENNQFVAVRNMLVFHSHTMSQPLITEGKIIKALHRRAYRASLFSIKDMIPSIPSFHHVSGSIL